MQPMFRLLLTIGLVGLVFAGPASEAQETAFAAALREAQHATVSEPLK